MSKTAAEWEEECWEYQPMCGWCAGSRKITEVIAAAMAQERAEALDGVLHFLGWDHGDADAVALKKWLDGWMEGRR